ncbi:MAG: exonuclease domain-containing protein [Desulfobulbaceae bacterium]|nr:exonuclease domain-containing protein [Desulfobulbaceae bacterium]
MREKSCKGLEVTETLTPHDKDIERLETILRDIQEAVVACDRNARILLYNSAAKRLFHNFQAMGLGQSLYSVCARAPIEHTLRMLKHRRADRDHFDPENADARFVCATVDGTMLLKCHVSLVACDTAAGCVFVFSFEDMTRQITEMGRQGHLLEKMIKDLRAPLTNLNTAAENLKTYPEMPLEDRRSFEDIIIRESAELTRRFESVVEESGKITRSQWPLFDVLSTDILGCVVRRFARDDDVSVVITGVPLWLHADSYSLVLVLEHLVRFVSKSCKVSEIDLEVLLGDRRVYIDIIWQGKPVPQAVVDSLLEVALPDTVSDLRIADVLARHDSEMWSQEHRRQGYSLLRIPVPDSPRQWEVPPKPLPERSEFYDFSIAECPRELGEMADQPLSCLNYVVFDTETTGFRPSEGDEILSIAAVRIVNGRILGGERFERLIKPRRPIPESSAPFLEITEDMLQDKPPVEVVLPQFKAFVNDAVLVAHNGAFDMNFFRRMEDDSGVVFDNPVVDTLLLALLFDPQQTDYTLESIGRWLSIEVMANRTILDDCFFTAQIFLGMLDLLAEQGITTLGDLMAAMDKVVEEKRDQSG